MCVDCIRPNCNGRTHLTKDAYLGCSQCGIELMDVIELVEEASLRSNTSCEICGLLYDSDCSNSEHFLSHFYAHPAKVFLCIECESTQTDADIKADCGQSNEGISDLEHDKGIPHNCNICNDKTIFASVRSLNKHNLQVHGIATQTRFTCRDCWHVFGTLSKLSYHRRKHHLRPGETENTKYVFPCRVCDVEIYKTKAERTQHENDLHRDRDTMQFPCPFCERTFSNTSTLALHLVKHTKKRDYKCDICNKSFSRFSHMEYHRTTHTELKLFDCDICEQKSFKTELSLQRHIIRMHTERPGYPCDMCEKVFKDTSDRRRHRRTHGGFEKTFKCSICEKAFYENKSLRFHMRTHKKNDFDWTYPENLVPIDENFEIQFENT